MSKLSRREQVMLYGLLCFLILAAGLYLFILPGVERRLAAKEDLLQAQLAQTQAQHAVSGVEGQKDRIQTLEEEIQAMSGVYYPRLKDEEVDRLVTGMLTSAGFDPQSLALEPPVWMVLSGGVPGGVADGEEGEAQQADPSASLLVAVVHANVLGSQESLTALVEAASANPSLRIESFSFQQTDPLAQGMAETVAPAEGDDQDEEDTEADETAPAPAPPLLYSLTVVFEVYMYEALFV